MNVLPQVLVRTTLALLAPALLSTLTSCHHVGHGADHEGVRGDAAPLSATARLEPASGSSVTGTVHLVEEADGVRITATIEGLTPDALHGFHIHEKGDCSAHDASSAGGHFNPHGRPHGGPDDGPDARHVGDLGNLRADAEGRASYERVNDLVELRGPHSVIDLAFIVHSGPDDFVTQPTGAAGHRVACGVIEPTTR